MLNKPSQLTQTLLGNWVHVHLTDTEEPVQTSETLQRLLLTDNGLLSVHSNHYVHILPSDPENSVSTALPVSQAQICTAGDYLAFYQQEGLSLYLFRGKKEVCTIDSEFAILSASVNKDGNVTLITEDSGHKSAVSVYRKDGTLIYRWHSGNQLATGAALSPHHNELAVCVLSMEKSKPSSTLYLFDLKKTDPILKQEFDSQIPTFCRFSEKNLVIIGFSDGICAFRRNGEKVYTINCNGAQLLHWSLEDPYAPQLLVLDNGTYSVLFYDYDRLIGRYDTNQELKRLTTCKSRTVVSGSDHVFLIDSHGRTLAEAQLNQEIRDLVLLNKKTIAVAVGNEIRFLKIK